MLSPNMPVKLLKLAGEPFRRNEDDSWPTRHVHRYEPKWGASNELPPQEYDVVATYAEVADIVKEALSHVPKDLVDESIKQLEARLTKGQARSAG